MTNVGGEIISVQIDDAGRPFFYIAANRAALVREALAWKGLVADPGGVGKVVVTDEMDPYDEGEEVVEFSSDADADAIQDALDEMCWADGRILLEVHP